VGRGEVGKGSELKGKGEGSQRRKEKDLRKKKKGTWNRKKTAKVIFLCTRRGSCQKEGIHFKGKEETGGGDGKRESV